MSEFVEFGPKMECQGNPMHLKRRGSESEHDVDLVIAASQYAPQP